MSYSHWQTQNPSHNKEFDVIIIGAGIAGASTAYWLKKEDPGLKVALLEKHQVCSGATGKNAGFVTCGSVEHYNRLHELHGEKLATKIWKFSESNLELLKSEIIQNKEQIFNFNNSGSFSLASSENEWQELQKTAAIMEKQKISVEILNENNINSRLGAQGFIGGIKYVDDACVDPVKLTTEILLKSNVQVFENTEVDRTEEQSGQQTLYTNKGEFKSQIIIYATNAYSNLLSPYFKDKIFPTRGQILMTEAVNPFMEGPCYAHFVLDYFRQLSSGHLIIGGFRQLEKQTEVGYSDHTTEIIQNALHQFVVKHLPQFKDKKVINRWAGVMGFSVDGQPMIGALPDSPQIFFLGGFTAHGLGLAFHTAKCLVDMIFERQAPEFISAKRFL